MPTLDVVETSTEAPTHPARLPLNVAKSIVRVVPGGIKVVALVSRRAWPLQVKVPVPAGPVAPIGPVAPLAPVAPLGPVAPFAPVAPTPYAPDAPFGPVAPTPLGPVAPRGPVAPAGPTELHEISLYPDAHVGLVVPTFVSVPLWRHA